MTLFVPLTVALAFLATALLALSWARSRPAIAPVIWTSLACIGLLALGSVALYASLGASSLRPLHKPPSAQSMVQQLQRKLDTDPNDLGGWLMLGRSYLVLQKYPLAVRAYQHALQLSANSTVALLGEAQALILSAQSSFAGRAGELIERALAHAPQDPQALFLGAVVALHRGELHRARSRFEQVLALAPTPAVKHVAEHQIASIDRQLGTGGAHRSDVVVQTRQSARKPLIRVRLELAHRLISHASSHAPLYLFVRDLTHPGAPLAVKRLSSHFPQTVVLSPSDAMVPGHTFTAGERVEVVARIAPSGNPLAERGDLSGQTLYRVGHEGLAEIRIDHITP